MRKALVIGGSNGMGLAVAKQLIDKGYYVIILDKIAPVEGMLMADAYKYQYCDLLELEEDLIMELAKDQELSVMMITAGFGRVADFEYFHSAEIKNMMTVNATSVLRIFRIFYERIKCQEDFLCGVMSSIAGLMSSPSAAVYAASKAALCRFVESVNIELEASGVSNRILDVAPASFKGSRFYGGSNQLELLEGLAREIVEHLFERETLFVPQYEEIFRGVLERYHKDPHEYGIHSYQYKKDSGRLDNRLRVTIGYLSGTFDLFHVGHLNLLRRAKEQCDYLIVGVHESGAWKGKETFVPFEERKAIVAACKYVDKVVNSCVEDSDAWEKWHYDKLFVGSDYKGTERFERYERFFQDKGVEIVYFPYTKSTSSSQVREAISFRLKEAERNQKSGE